MHTFAVSTDVDVAQKPKPSLLWDESIASMLNLRVEQLSTSDSSLVAADTHNALAKAAHDAFYEHRPLVLSPDAVWFCLAQGFAQHMSLNSELLRERFGIQHEGKKRLLIERPDFSLGQANPWPEAFAAFSQQVGGYVGKVQSLLAAEFSTTKPIHRAAYDVVVMDSFQAYFEYEMLAGCGIPSITLLGTVEDWKSVRARAAALGEYGLDPWVRTLRPVLDHFVRAAGGDVDADFWRSFFRYESGSGGAELTSWVLTLFPYLQDHTKKLVANKFFSTWEQHWLAAEKRTDWRQMPRDGAYLGMIPPGIASAPVKFTDVRTNKATELRFVAGMFGVTQDPQTLALAPEFAWAIVYDGVPLKTARGWW
jgi:hypothetical protein